MQSLKLGVEKKDGDWDIWNGDECRYAQLQVWPAAHPVEVSKQIARCRTPLCQHQLRPSSGSRRCEAAVSAQNWWGVDRQTAAPEQKAQGQ